MKTVDLRFLRANRLAVARRLCCSARHVDDIRTGRVAMTVGEICALGEWRLRHV